MVKFASEKLQNEIAAGNDGGTVLNDNLCGGMTAVKYAPFLHPFLDKSQKQRDFCTIPSRQHTLNYTVGFFSIPMCYITCPGVITLSFFFSYNLRILGSAESMSVK